MAVSSTPQERIELSNPSEYKRRLMARVGDRAPLDVLAETPLTFIRLSRAAPAEMLRRRPFPDKWSPTEVIGHLLDVEFVFGQRTRTIFCDAKPQIIGMDQEKWVAAQRHGERDATELASLFAAVRAVNLDCWRRIPKSAYDREGLHNERGPERLGEMLHYAAGHDLSHIEQFEKYLAALVAE